MINETTGARSRDFVPEPFPRVSRVWDSLDDLIASERSLQAQQAVLQCPDCGCLWDGSGPTVCPECENFTVVLPGATFDEDQEGGPDG